MFIGDGIGKFEGSIAPLVGSVAKQTLFERINIRIVVVDDKHIDLIQSLTETHPELNIAVISQKELFKFTENYNSQFCVTYGTSQYYNAECNNTSIDPFIEALAKHFALPLGFSEKVKPVVIEKRSVHKVSPESNKILPGRIDKISYCIEGLEQRQTFYNETQIKNAIQKGERLDNWDPIVYALFSGILLEKMCPAIYAVKNGIKIEGINVIPWLEENRNYYRVGYSGNIILYDDTLRFALESGDLKTVKYLIEEKKYDITRKIKNDGQTILHLATNFGKLEIVRYLVEERKADVKLANEHGQTLLYCVVKSSNLEMVKYLVEKGKADVNLENTGEYSMMEESPLYIAAENGDYDIVRCLVNEGGADVGLQNAFGETALDIAARHGDDEIVKFLQGYGNESTCHIKENSSVLSNPNTEKHQPQAASPTLN